MFNKQKIISYIEDKHLADGGYMFAKVQPSSGLDTYYAVRILKMLGKEPKYKTSIKDFFLELEAHEGIRDIIALFLTVEIFKELNYSIDRFYTYRKILEKEQNVQGGFGTTGDIYVEIASELETTYRAVVTAKDLHFPLTVPAIEKFIFSFQNKDGGFGSHELSLLATTYYALAILDKLEVKGDKENAIEYLRKKEEKISGFYLEELFWLVMSLHFLKQKPKDMQEIIAFLEDCARDNGGFCRSRNIGISTFEDTYYAITLITFLEKQGTKLFD